MTSPPPAPLLFDLDGTLIDSLPDIRASTNHLRRSFGLPEIPSEVARSYVGDGVFMLMERSLAELGPFEPLRERAWEIYREHHVEQCTRLVQPFPGVREHLERWLAQGRPMAIVTNKPRFFAERILTHLELTELLPVAICGDTLEVKKPHPEPLRAALRALGQPTDRGTMVGDGVQDLRAGRAAGLGTAAVLFGFAEESVLRAERADEYWVRFGIAE
jgi:phosphoglycolate phosphatase